MRSFGLVRVVCFVFLFGLAVVISSPAQTLNTLYNFCPQSGCTDGDAPYAGLVQGNDDSFYGITLAGGTGNCGVDGCGTVFKITSNGTLTTLHSFNGPDGIAPYSLLRASDGNFYGVTGGGGLNNDCQSVGCGTIFKITPSGTLTTLYKFCSKPDCTDGSRPYAGLVQASDGNLYGTTGYGGAGAYCFPSGGCGTIFRITPSGVFTTLYSFCNTSSYPYCPDGEFPAAKLVQGRDGYLYGTTGGGGGAYSGTVFKISLSGTFTSLHFFTGHEGGSPGAGLVQGSDGRFYGTTQSTVFKITTSGTLTVLHTFQGPDGASPEAELIQGSDGNFYGTTDAGGTNYNCGLDGCGTIFKITPGGTLTTLYAFGNGDGWRPHGALLQASDGNFYGTTALGGNANCTNHFTCGTVFSLTPTTVFSVAQFVPVTPCRIVDTRLVYGGNGPIDIGQYQTFDLPQLAHEKGCADLSNATAYSLNVTIWPGGPLGFLTLWPARQNRPLVSTLNSEDSRIKANAAIVPAGVGGAINIYASNTTDVILDINGYFATPSDSTLAFYPLMPCRVLDTRWSSGPLGGPSLTKNTERDFPVLSSTCNVPDTAAAYSMNFTVVPNDNEPLGYLTVWPEGSSMPVVSTLNNLTETIVANAALVPAGTSGGIAVYPSADTDLVADINGYFAPMGTGGLSLYPVVPCRVFDTRKAGGGGPFSGLLNPAVNVTNSGCGIPGTAQGYVFNATVVPAPIVNYLTLWPDTEDQPVVSTLNAVDGWITSNMAIVPNLNGKVDVYTAGRTQLVLDISAYFAP